MHTPAQIRKHPIHPMLVAMPIGLWVFSLVCDIVRATGSPNENWSVVALYTMVGGIVGALIAAVPGFIDMLSLKGGVKRIALTHMSINLAVVALYVVNVWMRTESAYAGSDVPFVLSLVAIAALVVSGWLGGKMVYLHHVAVEEPAEPVAGEALQPEHRASM
ncbi:MAG TPA: DUF2231 domain-containing protein [Albitalea sp.]